VARSKSITPEVLAALGAARLAAALVEHAETDPVLHKKLRMLLAGTEGPGKLAAEIDKRIQTIGRSRSFVDSDRRKPLVQELDHLRSTIATTLATQSPEDAAERLWALIGIADNVIGRVGDGMGDVEDVFGQAMVDLGRLCAALPPRDSRGLARRVLAFCDGEGFGSTGVLIRHLGEALGAEGRAELRRATEAALKSLPPAERSDDWREAGRRRRLASRLALLADLEQDADAYVAAMRAGGMESTHGRDVAERLIAANRPAEALEWLAKSRRRWEDADSRHIDLTIVALDALGRKDEAQARRWDYFERTLSAEHLRAFLKGLPDFEDFDAEQKALGVAAAHETAELALAFFIDWPALERADRLVRDRFSALDGAAYYTLRPAAEALEGKYPEAAMLLYRRMIESVLDRGSSKQYPYAARDLQSCARLAPRMPQATPIEPHATFVARLRKVHGRKYGFWGLIDQKGAMSHRCADEQEVRASERQ
jgi:hypothetical protein